MSVSLATPKAGDSDKTTLESPDGSDMGFEVTEEDKILKREQGNKIAHEVDYRCPECQQRFSDYDEDGLFDHLVNTHYYNNGEANDIISYQNKPSSKKLRDADMANEEGMASVSGPPADSNMHANNFSKKKDDVLVLPSTNENLTEDDLTKHNLTDKKLGEVGALAHLNENYIIDQFNVMYRPVYVGEAFTPKHDTLIYNNKYYTTEGLGNCVFCQGAGKITVEKLGLKDCPDCDGTGDVQQTQPSILPQTPNQQIPQQPNISQPEQQNQQPQITNLETPQEQPKKDLSKSGKRPDNINDFDKEDKPLGESKIKQFDINAKNFLQHSDHRNNKYEHFGEKESEESKSDYYVNHENGLLVLRQRRYKDQFNAGMEHPNDVMAYAHNQEEMDRMIKTITGESYAKEDDDWFTMKGNHIKIKKGQTKQQAVNDFLSKQKKGSSDVPKDWDNMTSDQKDKYMKDNLNKDNFNDFAKNIERHHIPPEPPKEDDLEDWKPEKQDFNDDYDADTGNPEEQDLDLSDNKYPSTTNYPDINKARQISKGRFKVDNSPPKKGDWDNIEKNEISDDTKKFSHKFARSKHNTKGLTAKQIQIKNTQYDKLKNIDNTVFEELDFAKHSDVWSQDGMAKYKDALAQKLGGRYDIDNDLHEWLTDDNYHSLTQALKELKAGIKDGEMESWWDNATKNSRDSLMGTDSDYYKQYHPNQYKTEKYNDLDPVTQSSLRARYIDRYSGQESKSNEAQTCKNGHFTFSQTKKKCPKCGEPFESNVTDGNGNLIPTDVLHNIGSESFSKVVEACGCKNKAMESIKQYENFIDKQINVLKKKARAGEGVGILYGLPNISKQGRKIKGTLAYAGVSLNDRIYLPETLAKGHGRTLPLLLNHSSTAGAEDELHRLTPEMLEYLENDRDYQVGEVTLTWDPEKLTLFYEGVVDHPFFQKEIDDMNMAVSLGIYYDSDSPTVCDEACYTLIKGAEFREVSLVYHAGFPIATIEAVEAKLKANALKAMNEGKLVTWHDPEATMNKKKHEQNSATDEGNERKYDNPLESAIHHRKKTEPDFVYKKEDYESVAEEEDDPLSRGGSVDVELKDNGASPTIDINDDLGTEPIAFETLTTKHDFSIRGVTGMTISNSNGVERYKLDPNMSYETNMIHFNVAPKGAVIFGEQLQPKMTTTPDITKILEAKPDISFTEADEDMFKKNKTLL